MPDHPESCRCDIGHGSENVANFEMSNIPCRHVLLEADVIASFQKPGPMLRTTYTDILSHGLEDYFLSPKAFRRCQSWPDVDKKYGKIVVEVPRCDQN